MSGSFKRDDSAKVNVEELEGERKDKFLKRVAKENKEAKKNAVETKVWFEIHGDKVLRKATKANGGVYSRYHCSAKKNKDEVQKLRDKGFLGKGK